MSVGGERWVEVSPSQFTHETEGLALLRATLPDESPFRAWSNFEFRDSRGRWHEVDLLVLGRDQLHLVELKYYSGTLQGDDHRWLRSGHRAEDSPLKLARRKAQYLASKLKDAYYDWVKEKKAPAMDVRRIVPFVQESVFLHHERFRCELSASSAMGLYGLDGGEQQSHLPGISELLFAAPRREPIGPNQEAILAELMARIGLVQRRERQAGSWTIADEALAAGEGWQDWLAHHSVAQQEKARIRFQVTPAGAPESEQRRVRRVAENEYAVMSRLQHDGILRPKDLVQSELGVGLAYDYSESWQRLDLWLAGRPQGIPLVTQLSIVRQIGEALQYAHNSKVVHRELAPDCIWIRDVPGTQDDVRVRVGGWQGAGVLDPANLTHTAAPGVTSLHGSEGSLTSVRSDDGFSAPEGAWSPTADRARIDVFGLGALAFYVIVGQAPATTRATLMTRLREQDGLDLAVELPQVSSELRDLVLKATAPAPTKRIGEVGTFLALLDKGERAANTGDEGPTDPLEATPGDVLDGRFELERRLGQGSTAVGLLVIDHHATGKPQQRVLKVALHDDAGQRLADEAEVLRTLKSPRVVKLFEGPITVGGRQALLLESAGVGTLSAELRERTRLSLDRLERYGNDLLEMVVALDKAGVDHRDIKPSNLGVRLSRGDRAKHLVLFDFSLTRAAASATSAGTPPYLDPFLTGARDHFDSAAERYAAAVVLFEMATGCTPQYGDDPDAPPAAISDDAVVTQDMFDSSLAPRFTSFFTRALARDAARRHETADEMRRAWAAIFPDDATTEPGEEADALAAAATLSTPLAQSGLTPRALSALEPERIETVGELLATDPVRIARLEGVADRTRRHINDRMKQWRKRLGDVAAPKTAVDRAAADNTLEAAAETLIAVATGKGSKARGGPNRAATVRIVLGYGTDIDALATQAQLGASLPDPVTPARASQILSELQRLWASDDTSRALLGTLVDTLMTTLADYGNVVTAHEATMAIERAFSGAETPDHRVAAGLLRLTLERVRELRRADEDSHAATFLRRRDGLVLIAHSQSLLDAADELGRTADLLISQSPNPERTVVPVARASVELAAAVRAHTTEPPETLIAPVRLAHLAAAVSSDAAATASGDLHHRDLSPATALALTFGDGVSTQPMKPSEIRGRVAARFPALAPLPERPALDELLRQASVQFIFDDRQQAYRAPKNAGDTTGLESRQPTYDVRSAPVAVTSDLGRRIEQSIRTRSFLTLGVQADRLARLEQGIVETYDAQLVDITGALLDALRSQAEQSGVPWNAVRAADAEGAGHRARQGLGELVKRSWATVTAVIDEALAATGSSPVVLTEAAPLARYDNMALLARWSDLGSSRARAVWLVAPQLSANQGSMIDGRPVPLATPTQFINLDSAWVDALAATTVTATP
ncbi:BREX system serine/threonine kinase PglW [Luteipulveratus mongoliensis]|uniref:non-specific serine/threonine protein kinase n=1 Tax=Luteipulveratus mongoliensis TaxID=571913 RepID=A0A0K1JDU0_9MICO|nr:BREX system serine/threonine kinase PglW [Luteipulveratus mongoliensis]AKU14876.1 hypothetical protein VV02_01675 [Luteipulveratus mongoliensis]